MSKISALDFANNVERNRKSLRQHCLANGEDVLDIETLDNVVAINNQINKDTANEEFKVEFKNIDGEYFAPTQYVNAGGSATFPTEIPTFDEEYLEFDYWATSASDSLENVQRDILCMPQYKTKYREDLGQRPTYLICYFAEGALSPTLQIGSIHTNTFVDWGDGSEPQQVTANTIAHTYASKGLYTITVYGDSYNVGGTNSGTFTGSSYKSALLKAYLGENVKPVATMLKSAVSLRFAVLPSNITNIMVATFNGCDALQNMVIPNSVTSIGSSGFSGCYALKNIIIPNSIKTLDNTVFANCKVLVNIVLPNSIDSLGNQIFDLCSTLTNANIPNRITEIPAEMFEGAALKNITIPNSIVNIGNTAFYNCDFETITIPSSVIRIDTGAFSSCQWLKNITIPSSVATMQSSIFNGCLALTNIVLYEDFDISGLGLEDSPLSDECLVDIANKLKDNAGLSSKTITFGTYLHKTRMQAIQLNEFGAVVPYGTAGAVSILEFMQNKNWTVAFTT